MSIQSKSRAGIRASFVREYLGGVKAIDSHLFQRSVLDLMNILKWSTTQVTDLLDDVIADLTIPKGKKNTDSTKG